LKASWQQKADYNLKNCNQADYNIKKYVEKTRGNLGVLPLMGYTESLLAKREPFLRMAQW